MDEFDLEPYLVGMDGYTAEVGYETTPTTDTSTGDDCPCGCGGTCGCGGHGMGRKLLIVAVVALAIWGGWWLYKKWQK